MIKRILCLMISILMILSVVSCEATPSVNNNDNTDKTGDSQGTADTPAGYDGIFKAGYARVDITPDLPYPQKDGNMMKTVQDPLYATCIAVNDGENTALIFTVDAPNIPASECELIRKAITKETKINEKFIMMSATHNHSAFTPGYPKNNAQMLKWSGALRTMMADAAKQAIADLSDAEIYVGQAKTPGYAFVRRYLHEDGSYSGVWTANDLVSSSKVVGEASQIDDTLQLIRFVRKDKKDIIMTNWQAHLASATDIMKAVVTADLVYYVRDGVEKSDDDALIAYFAGASGNINLKAPSHEMKKYRSYAEVGQALAKLVLETMPVANLKKINAGKINALTSPTFAVDSDSYPQEKIDQAKEVLSVASNKAKKLELMKQYGFESDKHINAIANGSTTSHKIELYLGALSFGDLAFVAAPYEMFDNNGVQIKEASKELGFDTTFVLTCAGGSLGYVASIEAYNTYGGYETYQTDVAAGTAEKLVEEYIRMLGELKSKS